MASKVSGRNALCWCGSGKKYKKCHLPADEKAGLERKRPPVPRAREYWELMRSILQPRQIRSDEVGPDRK